MCTSITLPILPEGRRASGGVGPMVPAAAALEKDLPPALIKALGRIGNQIEVEILGPLLCAASIDHLAETFERVFPRFRDYYVSTILVVLGWLQEDSQRFYALTIRSFQRAERLIRSHGPHWIGQDASLNALLGLGTMSRVARATSSAATSNRILRRMISTPRYGPTRSWRTRWLSPRSPLVWPRWRTVGFPQRNRRTPPSWRNGVRVTRRKRTTWPRPPDC